MLVNEVFGKVGKDIAKAVTKKADDGTDMFSRSVTYPVIKDSRIKETLKRIPLLNKKGEAEVRKTVGDELYDEQWTDWASQEVVSMIRQGLRNKIFRAIYTKKPDLIKELPPHEKKLFDEWLRLEPYRQKKKP